MVVEQQISLLGGIRSSAQMISYELAMGLSLLPVFLWVSVPGSEVSSLSLVGIVNSQKRRSLVTPCTAGFSLDLSRSPFRRDQSLAF